MPNSPCRTMEPPQGFCFGALQASGVSMRETQEALLLWEGKQRMLGAQIWICSHFWYFFHFFSTDSSVLNGERICSKATIAMLALPTGKGLLVLERETNWWHHRGSFGGMPDTLVAIGFRTLCETCHQFCGIVLNAGGGQTRRRTTVARRKGRTDGPAGGWPCKPFPES